MVDLRTLLALLAAAEVALATALWLGVTRRSQGIPQWSSALALRALAICIILTASQPQAGGIALGCG
jgi:hypothetical protein